WPSKRVTAFTPSHAAMRSSSSAFATIVASCPASVSEDRSYKRSSGGASMTKSQFCRKWPEVELSGIDARLRKARPRRAGIFGERPCGFKPASRAAVDVACYRTRQRAFVGSCAIGFETTVERVGDLFHPASHADIAGPLLAQAFVELDEERIDEGLCQVSGFDL